MHNYMGWKRVFFTYFCDFISTNLSIVASKCGINWTQTHTQFHMEKYYFGNEEYQNKTVLQPFKNTLMYKWLTALININSKRWKSRCHIFFCVCFFFFDWDSLHARLNSHYEAQGYKKKKHKKIKAYTKSV